MLICKYNTFLQSYSVYLRLQVIRHKAECYWMFNRTTNTSHLPERCKLQQDLTHYMLWQFFNVKLLLTVSMRFSAYVMQIWLYIWLIRKAIKTYTLHLCGSKYIQELQRWNMEQTYREHLPTIQWCHEIRASNNESEIRQMTATSRPRIFGFQFSVKPRRWKYT